MNDQVAVDALTGLLDGPRARGAFLLRLVLDPPWSIRIQDEAPLTVVALVRGRAWCVPDGGEPQRLQPGDVAVCRGPDPYTIADEPGRAPDVIVYPGQYCTSAEDGRGLVQEWDLGVRSWGTSRDGGTVMLVGTYEHAGEISKPLLAALPPMLSLSRDEWDSPLVPLLAEEMTKDLPGQRAVLDRLLDLLLIAILRTWFTRLEGEAPSWYRALGDPVVGPALRLLHAHPAQPWTVADLAGQSGTSRAVLARRFSELVGEPPMAYLTGWRLAMAADLLHRPDVTLGAVARQVGYGDAFSLSAAFKRVWGVSPQQYRQDLAAGLTPVGVVMPEDALERVLRHTTGRSAPRAPRPAGSGHAGAEDPDLPFDASPDKPSLRPGGTDMRYMVFISMAENAGPPPEPLAAAMDEVMRDGFASGVLVDAGGLYPSGQSLELLVRDGQVTTTDGPFAEAKEVVGGYAVVEVRDDAEAQEQGRLMARLHAELWPGWQGSIHVRRIAGPADGPPTA